MKKKGLINKTSNVSIQNNIVSSDNTEFVSNQIREIDPKFSSDAFLGWCREVFLKIQQAWSDRKWEEIRPFESNELFSQHNAQLEEYIKNNKINKIEKIAIKKVSLQSFKIDGDKEVLIVNLDAVMRDYVIDEKTNKVLESNPNKDWYMKYEMVFNRKAGVKTEPGLSNKSVTNCPNCGAPTEITSSGKCEYCKSIITTGEHDWVLSDIKSIN
jgi:predicted lipid-binding transport protein (Tim44 family)